MMTQKTVSEIVDEIKNNMKKSWVTADSKRLTSDSITSNPLPSSTHTMKKKLLINTMVQWELPIDLCPSCLARLRGTEAQMIKSWSNPAKEGFVKKKYTGYKKPKPPKVAKDEGVDGVVEI